MLLDIVTRQCLAACSLGLNYNFSSNMVCCRTRTTNPPGERLTFLLAQGVLDVYMEICGAQNNARAEFVLSTTTELSPPLYASMHPEPTLVPA